MVNEAALFAARQDERLVCMRHFEQAKDKIMMGAERKSMVMSEKERRNTAYHEAGHCIVGYLMPEHDPHIQSDDHPKRAGVRRDHVLA